MLKIIFAVFAALVFGLAQAADVTMQWDTDPAVQEYRVYSSTDDGATWNLQATSAGMPIIVNNVPDSGTVLLMGANYNATVGEVRRPETGIWYNGNWKPVTPSNIGTP